MGRHKDRAEELWQPALNYGVGHFEEMTAAEEDDLPLDEWGQEWRYLKVPQTGFDRLQPSAYADLVVFEVT